MVLELFRKMGRLRWLPWIGIAAFTGIPAAAMMFVGEASRGLGIFAFLSSVFVGMLLGLHVAHFLSVRVLKVSKEFSQRLTSGLSCFGFAFLPALVGSWTNAHLDTGINLHSLGAHFLWACCAGGIFFCIPPPASEEEESS